MKIYLFILYSLLFVSITCNQDKTEDIASDFFSGIMKGIYNSGDKIVNGVKGMNEIIKNIGKAGDTIFTGAKKVAVGCIERAETIGKISVERRMALEASLKGYALLKDKALYYKTLQELTDPNFIQKSAEIFDKAPIYNNIGSVVKTKIFEKTADTAGTFILDSAGKVLKVLPLASSAYNAYESVKRFSKGEIMGGTIKLAESAISFIPGLSFGVSILPSVASLVYDIAK